MIPRTELASQVFSYLTTVNIFIYTVIIFTLTMENLRTLKIRETDTIKLQDSTNPQGVYDQLNQIFSEQDQEGKAVIEARGILGDSAKDLTDAQVYDLVNGVQFLVDSWLEEYEKDVFDGKTLDELINI